MTLSMLYKVSNNLLMLVYNDTYLIKVLCVLFNHFNELFNKVLFINHFHVLYSKLYVLFIYIL